MCVAHYQRWLKRARASGVVPPLQRWTLEECQVDDMTARLPLTNLGREVVAHTLIDVDDWPTVSQHRWHAHNAQAGRLYAARSNGTGSPRRVYLHRLLMDAAAGQEVDHINHNTLDNRRRNLRLGNRALNAQNLSVQRGKTHSKYRGVTRDIRTGAWIAQVWQDGRNHYLGRFPSEEMAASVASDYRREHMPFAMD